MPTTTESEAILKPVERLSLSEQVFDRLCRAIVAGKFPVGSMLPSERTLCDLFGVNRGALREALKRLEQSRLIAIQQGGSTRILDFRASARLDIISLLLIKDDGSLDLSVARSVIELRAAITPDVVRLATERQDAELAPALLSLLAEMHSDSGDPVRAQELSERFWRIVVKATENIAYVLAFNTIYDVNERLKSQLLPFLSSYYQNIPAFEEMIEAILSNKPEEARRAAERHVDQIAKALTGQVDDLRAHGATAWRQVNLEE
jgi:GntR family transcriptional repressor for pyruvate dehydrogenase complex